MAKAIKRRRGTTEEHKTFVGLDGEITVDTTKKTLVLHDQETAGGFPMARESSVTNLTAKVETLENKATQAETAIESKINKEEAEQTFVHKNGDEEINGVKSLKGSYLRLCNKNIKKGDVPVTENMANAIYFDDNTGNGIDRDKKTLGYIQSTIVKDSGESRMELTALLNDGSATPVYGRLQIGVSKDGTIRTVAPTPPITDNSVQIATTAWVRSLLTRGTSQTIYVRKNGNNDNDGLTEDTAVATISNAILKAFIFRNMGRNTIDIGEGEFGDDILALSGPLAYGSYGTTTPFIITGAGKDKTVLTHSRTTQALIGMASGCCLTLQKMTLKSNGHPNFITVGQGANLVLQNIKFTGNITSSGIYVSNGGLANVYSDIDFTDIAGSTSKLLFAINGGVINISNFNMVNVSCGVVANVSESGRITLSATPFGAKGTNVTGQRYSATYGGIINTRSRGESIFPGTTAGAVSTGGQYL